MNQQNSKQENDCAHLLKDPSLQSGEARGPNTNATNVIFVFVIFAIVTEIWKFKGHQPEFLGVASFSMHGTG